MSNRPHPTELKAGDLVASPWSSNIRVLKVTSVETTTLGEVYGEKLNPDLDPATKAYAVHGNPYFGETDLPEPENPSSRFVFAEVGNLAYSRPILLKNVERGVEL